jgi:hypothetical protein
MKARKETGILVQHNGKVKTNSRLCKVALNEESDKTTEVGKMCHVRQICLEINLFGQNYGDFIFLTSALDGGELEAGWAP